jgi:hypothetical protein
MLGEGAIRKYSKVVVVQFFLEISIVGLNISMEFRPCSNLFYSFNIMMGLLSCLRR